MLKLMKSLSLVALLIANCAFAQPTNIQLEYDVSHNGSDFGTVKESFVQTGDAYHIVSITKGKGLYALLGERVLMSDGYVSADGLKPSQFQLKRGDNAKKSLTANFDWTNLQLMMLKNGVTQTASLVPGALDLASYPYQFMFTPPAGAQVNVTLTTGKKLDNYVYNIAEENAIVKVGAVSYQTLHLVNAEVDGNKRKELWLAKSKHYLPVKYLVVEKNGDKIEQTLTKISIQSVMQ